MATVGLPLTGTGGTTADVAVDSIGGAAFQFMKMVDGTSGSTKVASVLETTPGGTTGGLVTRPICSTAFTQAAALVLGTSATYQFVQSIPFSSGNVSRTSVASSIDVQIIAANANRKALVIANGSTAQMVGIGFTTAALTTARANVSLYLQANAQLRMGLVGDLPLYLGPVRAINLTSTSVTGGVIVTEFT